MKRFENCIRVITGFFAVLLGFGLKHLLDGEELGTDRNPCFVLAVLLFVRFLLGSINHLWYVYVRLDQGVPQAGFDAHATSLIGSIIKDFLFLLIFGWFGIAICYASSVPQFLVLNLLLCAVGFVWGFADWIRRRFQIEKWDFWILVNLSQSVFVGMGMLFHGQIGRVPGEWFAEKIPKAGPLLGPTWDWALVGLVVSYFLLLGIDFYCQLRNLTGDLTNVAAG